MEPFDSIERLEGLRFLDKPSNAVGGLWQRLVPAKVRDVLHGTFQGHPLHPVLILVPLGSWLSASFLDTRAGAERHATALVGLGLAGAAPSVAAGVTDWAELHPDQKRVGTVHALVNVAAVGLYTGSLVARMRGQSTLGKGLGFAGLAAVTVGGSIGGHLTYRQGAGVSRVADVASELLPRGWQPLGRLEDLPDGEAVERRIGDVPLFVLRRGAAVDVLADHCSHLAGPLHEGELTGDGCIVCPWHGSVFRLSDGSVVTGPATAPAPKLQVRLDGDQVLVRRPGMG